MPGRIKEEVISEVIDGEVVAIDLATGVYYNLRGSAVPCWVHMTAGRTDEELVEMLMTHYDVEEDKARESVDDLVRQTREFGLFGPPGTMVDSDSIDTFAVPGQRADFEPPVVDRYDEMAYVLALDPIHEVDVEAGWPKQA